MVVGVEEEDEITDIKMTVVELIVQQSPFVVPYSVVRYELNSKIHAIAVRLHATTNYLHITREIFLILDAAFSITYSTMTLYSTVSSESTQSGADHHEIRQSSYTTHV